MLPNCLTYITLHYITHRADEKRYSSTEEDQTRSLNGLCSVEAREVDIFQRNKLPAVCRRLKRHAAAATDTNLR